MAVTTGSAIGTSGWELLFQTPSAVASNIRLKAAGSGGVANIADNPTPSTWYSMTPGESFDLTDFTGALYVSTGNTTVYFVATNTA